MPPPEALARSLGREPSARPCRRRLRSLGAGPGVADRLVPALPGILTADEVLATGEHIAARQAPSGAIGWPDGHADAWNHVECAMALSACGLTGAGPAGLRLAARRPSAPDGSWPKQTEPATRSPTPAAESNHAAYVAVGVWHEFLVTGDEAFAAQMWPTVRGRSSSCWACRRRAARSSGSARPTARRPATRC